MKGIGRAAVVVAVFSSAALGGQSCTKDDRNQLTPEEYFGELQTLDKRLDDESAAADAAFESDDLEENKRGYAEAASAVDRFVSNLAALNPPAEAREAHNTAVEAGTDLVNGMNGASAAVQDAESEDELTAAIFLDATVREASDKFRAACQDLEKVAGDNGIEVALSCANET